MQKLATEAQIGQVRDSKAETLQGLLQKHTDVFKEKLGKLKGAKANRMELETAHMHY